MSHGKPLWLFLGGSIVYDSCDSVLWCINDIIDVIWLQSSETGRLDID